MIELPRMLRPCGGDEPCPWRVDAPPGQFPPERYVCLARTSRRPDEHGMTDAAYNDPMFACHASPEGAERACASWLAVEGRNHIGVRLALAMGHLDPAALRPGPDWPALHPSYAHLAAANGVTTLMLTDSPDGVTIGDMTETTITREASTTERRRTPSYLLVETLLRARHPEQPDLTLEGWVLAQRHLGVAWRPMAPKLAEAAGLTGRSAVGYEALRRWFDYLEPDEDSTDAGDGNTEALAARTSE